MATTLTKSVAQPTGFSTGQKITFAIGVLLITLLTVATIWFTHDVAQGSGAKSALSILIGGGA